MTMSSCLTPTLLPLLLLLWTGAHVLSADLCMTRGSECRAPFGLDVAYEALFKPACHRHSICYSCGASKGLTKAACDEALHADMYEACAPLSGPPRCRFQADNVFALQTHVVGTNFFHQARLPASWCVEHGIEACLPSATTTTTAAAAAVAAADAGSK